MTTPDPTPAPDSWLDDLPAELHALEAAHLTRRRRSVRPAGGASLWVEGRRMLAFCSNDYLGLSQHPALVEAAVSAIRRYAHGDLGDLEAQLATCGTRRRLIITDAVFSMDGDVADIPALIALAER